jgi:hypothetical protein
VFFVGYRISSGRVVVSVGIVRLGRASFMRSSPKKISVIVETSVVSLTA